MKNRAVSLSPPYTLVVDKPRRRALKSVRIQNASLVRRAPNFGVVLMSELISPGKSGIVGLTSTLTLMTQKINVEITQE